MTLKEQKAREEYPDDPNRPTYEVRVQFLPAMKRTAFQAGWDAALEWASKNAYLTIDTTYSRTWEPEVDPESILQG